MLKKIMSLVFIMLLLSSNMIVPFAETQPEILLSKPFDDYRTNSLPSDITFTGRCSGVAEYGKQNKGLSFKSLGIQSGATFTKGVSDNVSDVFFMSFDVMTNALADGAVNLATSTKTVTLLQIQENRILTHNGKSIGALKKDGFVNIAVQVRSNTGEYDVYIDGKRKEYRFYCTGLPGVSASGLQVLFRSAVENAEVIIDNVRIVNGLYDKSISYPKVLYNSRADEEIVFQKQVTDSVYYYDDFEDGEFLNKGLYPKDNLLEVTEEGDGNHVLTFRKLGKSDLHVDLFDFNYDSDVLTYQMDIRIATSDTSGWIRFIDTSSTPWNPIVFLDGGMIRDANGTVKTLQLGKWYTLSLVFDYYEQIARVYIDGVQLGDEFAIPKPYNEWNSVRIHVASGQGTDELSLDKVAVYGGDELKSDFGDVFVADPTIDVNTTQSIFEPDDYEMDLMEGKVGYHPRSGVVYANGTRTMLSPLPVETDGVLMVPAGFFETAYGMEISTDEVSGSLRIGQLELTAGNRTGLYDGEEVSLNTAPMVTDGVYYVPLNDICVNVLKKTMVRENTVRNGGFVVISDTSFSLPTSEEDLVKLNAFLFYARPTSEQVEEEFVSSELYGVHPRLMASKEDFRRINADIQTDEQMASWYSQTIAMADEYVADPTPIKYELRDGVRLLYVAYEFLDQMITLGLAYNLTGDEKYAERAWLDMEAAATFPDWHPAHNMDVGVMAHAFAIGYDWMYHYYTPEQRELLEQAAMDYGLYLFYTGYTSSGGWFKTNMLNAGNFNPVLNGGAIMLSVAIGDKYPDVASWIISNALRASENAVILYAPDGIWFEGAGYASITMEYFAREFSTLKHYFGHTYTLDLVEGVDRATYGIIAIQHKLGNFQVEEAGVAESVEYREEFAYFADHFDQYHVMKATWSALGVGNDIKNGSCLLWYRPEKMAQADAAGIDLELDVYASYENILTMRSGYTSENDFFVATKGNSPSYSYHRHINSGTFNYWGNGVQWATDLGADNYEAHVGTGFERYDYYLERAEGHNCLVVDPDSGPEYEKFAEVEYTKVLTKPRGVIGVLDMKPAFEDKVLAAKRGFFFTDNRQSLVVRDEVVLDETKEHEVYWFMQTNQICEADETGVTLTDRKDPTNQVRLEFVCSEAFEVSCGPAEPLDTSPQPPNNAKRENASRISLKTIGSGSVTITAKLTPITIVGTSVSEYDVDMESWSIPDGELEIPTLTSLDIDGKEYDTDKRIITHNLKKAVAPGAIHAISEKYDVETETVQDGSDGERHDIITVTDPADPSNASRYIISYIHRLEIEDIVTYEIQSLEVSDEPQQENHAGNLTDNDFNTRWSAEHTPTVFVDLGEAKEIDCVAMAFLLGDQRTTKFSIRVSEDGKDYQEVFNGNSSGLTTDYECFEIGNRTARYIEIQFGGSSTTTWNSVTELAIGKIK